MSQQAPEWWTLFSRTLGALVLQDLHLDADGMLTQSGGGLIFYDATDARRAEQEHRETYPRLDVVAVPLSSVMQHRPNDAHLRGPRQLGARQATYLYGTPTNTAMGLADAVIVLDVRVSTNAPERARQAASMLFERATRVMNDHPMLCLDHTLTLEFGRDDAPQSKVA